MKVVALIALIIAFFTGLELGAMYWNFVYDLTNIFFGFVLGCGFATLLFAEEIKEGSKLLKKKGDKNG
jgi:hypothetical protein